MQTMSFAANADMEQVHQCIIDIYHSSIYVMVSHFQFLPVKNVKRSFAILILHDWHFVSKICDMFFFQVIRYWTTASLSLILLNCIVIGSLIIGLCGISPYRQERHGRDI